MNTLVVCVLLALVLGSFSWDGSLAPLVANPSSFCSAYGFGMNKPYICAGGGSSGGGGGCDATACSSGQYTFTAANGWKINVPHSLAGGRAPYRAFAYVPFCDGAAISSCWSSGQTQTFSFEFQTENIAQWTSYVSFLFWTDGGGILGIVPPKAPSAKDKVDTSLVLFPTDGWPNNWLTNMTIVDNKWYTVSIDFTTGGGTMTKVSVDGQMLGEKSLGVNVLGDSNGPQIGVYQFDYQNVNPSVSYFNVYLRNLKLAPAMSLDLSGQSLGI